MDCKVCGYKLTQLFTSYACDRCDGLVKETQNPGPICMDDEEDEEMVIRSLMYPYINNNVFQDLDEDDLDFDFDLDFNIDDPID